MLVVLAVEIVSFPQPLTEGRVLLHRDSSLFPSDSNVIAAACDVQPLSRKWFAVYTTHRHEKRVSQHFQLREISHFLPLYRAHRRWNNGSRTDVDLPLFPGYLFVNIGNCERVRVLQVPGVISVVGGLDGKPASISEEEIESLRAGVRHRRAEPHPYLAAGQRVRIRSGALAGNDGTVVRVKNGLRVVLTLDLIMQSFAVEVTQEELEPLESAVNAGVSALCNR
ncbi:MAG: UpxY family transcription antiterminator [Terracidiphilus sp.]